MGAMRFANQIPYRQHNENPDTKRWIRSLSVHCSASAIPLIKDIIVLEFSRNYEYFIAIHGCIVR